MYHLFSLVKISFSHISDTSKMENVNTVSNQLIQESKLMSVTCLLSSDAVRFPQVYFKTSI